MAGKLDGKTALISGVSDGIGGQIARRFAAEGANVACTGIQMDLVDEVAATILGSGGQALSLELDVTSDAAWASAIAATIDSLGGLDIVVNNAGVLLLASIEDTTPADFRRVHSINSEGTYLGMRQAILAMQPGGAAGNGGCIINISSVAASAAVADEVAYASSKAAVSAMTRLAAGEYADRNIRINCICPGVVRTGMLVDEPENIRKCTEAHPLGIGDPQDVAAAALYLASDDARWVTGTELIVDGGMSVRP